MKLFIFLYAPDYGYYHYAVMAPTLDAACDAILAEPECSMSRDELTGGLFNIQTLEPLQVFAVAN